MSIFNDGEQKIEVRCKCCTESGVNNLKFIRKEELKIRPTGYKGAYQIYTRCDRCGTDITIPDSQVPKSIMKYLNEKWICEYV